MCIRDRYMGTGGLGEPTVKNFARIYDGVFSQDHQRIFLYKAGHCKFGHAPSIVYQRPKNYPVRFELHKGVKVYHFEHHESTLKRIDQIVFVDLTTSDIDHTTNKNPLKNMNVFVRGIHLHYDLSSRWPMAIKETLDQMSMRPKPAEDVVPQKSSLNYRIICEELACDVIKLAEPSRVTTRALLCVRAMSIGKRVDEESDLAIHEGLLYLSSTTKNDNLISSPLLFNEVLLCNPLLFYDPTAFVADSTSDLLMRLGFMKILSLESFRYVDDHLGRVRKYHIIAPSLAACSDSSPCIQSLVLALLRKWDVLKAPPADASGSGLGCDEKEYGFEKEYTIIGEEEQKTTSVGVNPTKRLNIIFDDASITLHRGRDFDYAAGPVIDETYIQRLSEFLHRKPGKQSQVAKKTEQLNIMHDYFAENTQSQISLDAEGNNNPSTTSASFPILRERNSFRLSDEFVRFQCDKLTYDKKESMKCRAILVINSLEIKDCLPRERFQSPIYLLRKEDPESPILQAEFMFSGANETSVRVRPEAMRSYIRKDTLKFLQDFIFYRGENPDHQGHEDKAKENIGEPPAQDRTCRLSVSRFAIAVTYEFSVVAKVEELVVSLCDIKEVTRTSLGDCWTNAFAIWKEDIFASQKLDIVAQLPFIRVIFDISKGAYHLVYDPWTSYTNGESVIRGIKKGLATFGEALFVGGSRLAEGTSSLMGFVFKKVFHAGER
eukprot:TRINITY_DN1139_c0_g1_i10.p1 TRINITY_DN1139_c0_g1~~TRINITY_DN1139_c0_g1_i10.p1  ORF type:complete len:749 (+),score=88.87 TRINITY_DN1139_c0_g1_i10:96-2249(+)